MSSGTILFQPPNRIGLGHISRLLAIALEVRQAAPDTRLPFIVEGEGHGLIGTYGFPQLNIPTAHDLYRTPRWSGWDAAERYTLVRDVAAAAIRTLAPDVVVFDTIPNRGVASVAIERGIPIACCLRKMKGMDAFFEAVTPLLPAVRLILVPHEAGAFEVPAEWRSRTVFTGSIVRPSPGDASIAARAHARRVVITGGGGGYPGTVDFYNLAIQAAVHARAAHPSMEILLVAGPLFTDWWHLSLADGIRVIPFDPGLSQTFASADVVLCQAGYNTVAELIALGVPSIAVPAPRDHDDQFERAIASAKSSSCFEVYSGDSPEAFGRLIVHALQRGPVSARVVQPAPGARSAAASLLNLLSDH